MSRSTFHHANAIAKAPLRLVPPEPLQHNLCMRGGSFWLNHDDGIVDGKWRCKRCGSECPTEQIYETMNLLHK